MFENGVLRKIFEPMREEITGELGKWQNDGLHYTYSLANTIGVTKYRRMILPGHVARVGEQICIEELRPRRRWKTTLKCMFNCRIVCRGLDSTASG